MTQKASYSFDAYQIWQPLCFYVMDMVHTLSSGMEWLPLPVLEG